MHGIDALVEKYMAMLQVAGSPPVVKVVSRLGGGWLGRDTWSSKMPHTTTLEIQRTAITVPRTLERIVAHEMVHHRDALLMTDRDRTLLRLGIKPDAHGAQFKQGAALINSVMGPDFVTVTSDREYQVAPLAKEIFLLIIPVGGGRLGYAWAARLSADAQEWIRRKTAEGARLVRSRDEGWTVGRAKIRPYGGASIPKKDTPEEAELRQLYDQAVASPMVG